MSVNDYRWHYDYARLAWDSGFVFQSNLSKSTLDKNIGHVDIEQIIRERDIASIEKHVGSVLEFSLDNEQTRILDPNFVKIFRIGQLLVQYLVFCKKYLDNTVVIIKKELTKNNEETKNLKCYVEELKQELSMSKKQVKELKAALSCQIATNQNGPVFQCNECPKAFSTEEYLLAHIKRRHELFRDVKTTNGSSFQVETDKLQLEIKELKERLNNTEKYIIHDTPPIIDVSKVMNKTNSENVLLKDLQQKFEFLKNHVENELCILRTQKFDQEKYEQWFEMFLKRVEESHVKTNDATSEYPAQKSDIFTQTDFACSPKSVVCRNCQLARHSPVFRTTQITQTYPRRESFSDGENKRFEPENNLGKFEELLEEKVTGSIEKLQHEMQSFWHKMNENEKRKFQNLQREEIDSKTLIEKKPPKPRPKPVLSREKFNSRSPNAITKTTEIKLPESPKIEMITLKEAGTNFKAVSDSESDESESSESSEDESSESECGDAPPITKPSNVSTLGQRSLTSLEQAAFTPEVLEGLQKEIEKLLNGRLEELGVSPQWKTLPMRSYQRAVNIVSHQANLIQKNIYNYMHIRNRILKNVDHQILQHKNKNPAKQSKFRNLLSEVANKTKLITKNNSSKVPIPSKRKNTVQQNRNLSQIHQKPQRTSRMYKSDSESDLSLEKNTNKTIIAKETQKAYLKVIEEFNTTVALKTKDLSLISTENSDFKPIQGPKQTEFNEEDKIAKSALKNYPSVGSLQKKKVIFDLDSSTSHERDPEKPVAIHKTTEGGSTTSLASSVLDYPNMKKTNELSDVSDWDLSEMLD